MSRRIRYSQDQWIALVNEIEADDGFQAEDGMGMPEKCVPRVYEFVGHDKLDPKDRVLEGCGNTAIFEINYDPHEPVYLQLEARDFKGDPIYDSNGYPKMVLIDHTGEAGATAVAHSVKACATCDAIGWWPRYAHVMEET